MGFSPKFNFILYHLSMDWLCIVVFSLPVQFFYRYLLVCHSYSLSMKQYIGLLILALSPSLVIVAMATYSSCSFSNENIRIAEAIFFNGQKTPELAYFAGPVRCEVRCVGIRPLLELHRYPHHWPHSRLPECSRIDCGCDRLFHRGHLCSSHIPICQSQLQPIRSRKEPH